MIIISKYKKERRKDGKIHILSEEDNVCPLCFGAFQVIGVRDRSLIESTGIIETLVIRRLRCEDCFKIHHELPDMIIPYKRHCAETIENVIAGDSVDICCDLVTEYRIKKWWITFYLYFERVKVSLQMKYGANFPLMLTPKKIVRIIANTNLWVHTRTAMTPI